MSVTGKQLINGEWVAGQGGHYQARNPATGEDLAPQLSHASPDQIRAATAAAGAAAEAYGETDPATRARFLERCAEEIMALGDELPERVMAETGYPRARAEGERGRTCNQLKLFARTVERGDYLDVRIDPAQPERQPAPRPDIRFCKQPLGPVAVFGSSNFPLAFSAGGGDTASALAAGCPVVVKSHNSHPGSGELVAQAIQRAAEACGLPGGVYSFISGPANQTGAAVVQAPEIRAVGFTGSLGGGSALFKLANERPDPIPFFAEMGSINPVVLLNEALEADAAGIAEGFVGSLTLGTGQFCVNPGLVIAERGAGLEAFKQAAGEQLKSQPAGVMLNDKVADGYTRGFERLAGQSGVEAVALGEATGDQPGCRGQAGLYSVGAGEFLANPALQEEVFGPASLVIECADRNEVLAVLERLDGQLTGTIQGSEAELAAARDVLTVLRRKVGRVVINNFPTGVEVCDAMMHGGPYPASTDSRFTSVGTAAIDRFVRPICYQNCPPALLPPAVQDANPWKLNRLVDGEWSRDTI